MKNRRLKKPVIYALWGTLTVAVIGGIVAIEFATAPKTYKGEDVDHVNKTIFEENIPVVSDEPAIVRPYLDSEIKVVKSFYDYQSDAGAQQNSILYYENTYLQNSGVSYGGKEKFDVVAVLAGKVTSVKEDQLLGKVIEITHDNNIISIYQSLSEVTVKENDQVTQGQVIGKSGTANMTSDLGDHLHFELAIKGALVNPELYYDKKVKDL